MNGVPQKLFIRDEVCRIVEMVESHLNTHKFIINVHVITYYIIIVCLNKSMYLIKLPILFFFFFNF